MGSFHIHGIGELRAMSRMMFLQIAVAVVMESVALTAQAATVQLPESWTNNNLAGWTNQDLSITPAPLTVEAQALKLVFAPGDFNLYSTVVMASTNASGARFVGDYFAGGVADITFRLRCVYQLDVETNAPTTQLWFYNDKTSRLWKYPIASPPTGVWTTVTVPIEYSLFSTESSNNQWSAFLEDVTNMSWVGVWFACNAPKATETFQIDDFQLLGPGVEYATWIGQYPEGTGIGGRHRFPHGDLDGDGISNWDEWTAGTEADDSNDVFRLRIDAPDITGGPVKLSWDAKTARRYSLWRTASAIGQFSSVATNLDTNTYADATSTNTSACFYRLSVIRLP